jgi:transposase
MQFKRQLADQSFEPGASVASITRQNEANANLLFRGRHQYLDGAFGLLTVRPTGPAYRNAPPALLHDADVGNFQASCRLND